MRRVLFDAGCVILVSLFVMGVLPSRAFSQIGIIVSPENPCEVDTLEITINYESTMHPVLIDSTSVEVTAGLIKITADVICGYYYMVTPYTINVAVPPVAADTYDIQYWSNEECHLASNPMLSSEIVVSPAPIEAGSTTWGAIKALLK
jgi:hypothetical protein